MSDPDDAEELRYTEADLRAALTAVEAEAEEEADGFRAGMEHGADLLASTLRCQRHDGDGPVTCYDCGRLVVEFDVGDNGAPVCPFCEGNPLPPVGGGGEA